MLSTFYFLLQVLYLLVARLLILYAFDNSYNLYYAISYIQKQNSLQSFFHMLVQVGSRFSIFLAFNLLVNYLCRLQGKLQQQRKQQGLLLQANQIIQNSIQSFIIFFFTYLLYCRKESVSTEYKISVVWLFMIGRILFAVLYYLGYMIGASFIRASGVIIQFVTVGIMLFKVFFDIELLDLIRGNIN